MSRNIKLLVLGGVVVLLAVFVIVFGKKLSTDTSASASATPAPTLAALGDEVELVPFAASDMTEISIEGDLTMTARLTAVKITTQTQSEDGTLTQETTEGKAWKSADFDVSDSVLSSMSSSAGNLKSERLIEENPADPAIYGLTMPTRTITFKTADKQATIEIGNITQTGEAYYVRVKGETKVYTADEYSVSSLLPSKLEMMNRQLFAKSGLVADNITALTFYRDGSEVMTTAATAEPLVWQITYPLQIKADYQDLATMLTGLASFSVNTFVSDSSDKLADFGLDVPAYQFNYTMEEQQYVLKLGAPDKEGNLYAMMDGVDGVFTVSADSFNFKDKPLIELVDTFVYMPTIYDTERLVISLDGRTDEFLFDVKKDSEDPEKITFNGRELTTDEEIKEAKGYFQGAIGMMGDTIDLDAKPSGTAEITLEYWLKDTAAGEKHVLVELIPTPDGYGLYAMKNGTYTGMVLGYRYLESESLGIRPAYEVFKAVLDKNPQ